MSASPARVEKWHRRGRHSVPFFQRRMVASPPSTCRGSANPPLFVERFPPASAGGGGGRVAAAEIRRRYGRAPTPAPKQRREAAVTNSAVEGARMPASGWRRYWQASCRSPADASPPVNVIAIPSVIAAATASRRVTAAPAYRNIEEEKTGQQKFQRLSPAGQRAVRQDDMAHNSKTTMSREENERLRSRYPRRRRYAIPAPGPMPRGRQAEKPQRQTRAAGHRAAEPPARPERALRPPRQAPENEEEHCAEMSCIYAAQLNGRRCLAATTPPGTPERQKAPYQQKMWHNQTAEWRKRPSRMCRRNALPQPPYGIE